MSRSRLTSRRSSALRRFRQERIPCQRAVQAGSLLDLIAVDPECFSDVSIVLTGSSSTQIERDEIRAAMKRAYPKEIEDIDALADSGIFTGWEARDLNRWCRTFIEMWMPRKRLSVYGRGVAYFCDSKGFLISRSANWTSIRKLVEVELPTLTAIAQTDSQIVRQFLDEFGGKLFSASELAAEIKKRS